MLFVAWHGQICSESAAAAMVFDWQQNNLDLPSSMFDSGGFRRNTTPRKSLQGTYYGPTIEDITCSVASWRLHRRHDSRRSDGSLGPSWLVGEWVQSVPTYSLSLATIGIYSQNSGGNFLLIFRVS